MKALVLGSTGLLGQPAGAELRRRGWSVCGAARSGAPIALDVEDGRTLEEALGVEDPDLVFNCAALVDVQACEADPDRAWRVNARPLAFLADWSKRTGKRLIHVSTDHFFPDGTGRPHTEDELPFFLNEYARTKYAGDCLALSAPRALVFRTSIVGVRGWSKPTFAEWAISAVEEQQPITLFSDAYTSSIDTGSFMRAAVDLLEKGATGLLNVAASEVYSKESFIRVLARRLGRPLDNTEPGSAGTLRPPRPTSLGLDVSRAEAILGRKLPGLEEVVAAVLDQHRERAAA